MTAARRWGVVTAAALAGAAFGWARRTPDARAPGAAHENVAPQAEEPAPAPVATEQPRKATVAAEASVVRAEPAAPTPAAPKRLLSGTPPLANGLAIEDRHSFREPSSGSQLAVDEANYRVQSERLNQRLTRRIEQLEARLKSATGSEQAELERSIALLRGNETARTPRTAPKIALPRERPLAENR